MAYPYKYDDAETGLRDICSAVGNIGINSLLTAIYYKGFDETDVEMMTCEVAEQNEKVRKEYLRLKKYEGPFLKAFVTDDNEYYSTACLLLRRIKSGLKETRDICRKFCQRAPRNTNRYVLNGVPLPSLYRASAITSKECTGNLFGLETYPACVTGLFHEMMKFRQLIQDSITLCFSIIRQVEEIRQDAPYCKMLYEQFKKEALKTFNGILLLIPQDSLQLSPQALLIAKLRQGNPADIAFAPKAYHSYNRGDMKVFVLKEAYDEMHNKGLTPTEQSMWGNNADFIYKVRYLIKNFDHLLPTGYNRKHLPGRQIAMLMRWCGITREDQYKTFINYFNDSYTKAGGQYAIITYGAVIKGKNKLLKAPDGEAEYSQFVNSIEQLLPTPQQKPQRMVANSDFSNGNSMPFNYQSPSISILQ